VLRRNLERLGVESGFHVVARGVQAFLRGKVTDTFDVVYLDPPWDAAEEFEATLGLLGGVGLDSWFGPQPPNARDQGRPLLDQDALVIAEHRRKSPLKDRYGRLERTRVLEQGDAALSVYRIGELLK
jgi:16S rRNA G966 N2-methylase RsmD